MKDMIKLVIIDFDDTLSMTEEACFSIENYIAGKMGFPPMERAAHMKNWGKSINEAIAERIPGIDTEKFMEFHRALFSGFVRASKLDVISGQNIATLKALKNDGRRLAILTARGFHEVEHLLDNNHHINRWIEKIYHAGNSQYPKPDSRAFDQILKDFGANPTETVYVGDSVNDGISAKGAGFHFIACLESGLRTKKDFEAIPVDFFAASFPEIIDYIK